MLGVGLESDSGFESADFIFNICCLYASVAVSSICSVRFSCKDLKAFVLLCCQESGVCSPASGLTLSVMRCSGCDSWSFSCNV